MSRSAAAVLLWRSNDALTYGLFGRMVPFVPGVTAAVAATGGDVWDSVFAGGPLTVGDACPQLAAGAACCWQSALSAHVAA
jgi:hypothetical protein